MVNFADKGWKFEYKGCWLVVVHDGDLEWLKRVLNGIKYTLTEIPATRTTDLEYKYRYQIYVPPSQGFCKLVFTDDIASTNFFVEHFRGDYEISDTRTWKTIDKRDTD